MKLGFIINSLMDVDFYKFAMAHFIFNRFRSVPVKFGFKNRTIKVRLGEYITEAELRRELDHVMTLRFNNTDIHYLRGTNEYDSRMFSEPWLQFLLNGFKLPPYELKHDGKNIELTFFGEWPCVTLWETICLAIVNELYFRKLMGALSPGDQKDHMKLGRKRLDEKCRVLLKKENGNIVFSEFGTRRRFSREWQDYVVRTLKDRLPPTQFRGTSNVFLAMKYGLLPMGTMAHELYMVAAGCHQRSDDELRNSPNKLRELWWAEYGRGLSVDLPDTFGSDHVFRTMPREQAEMWKGFRQDSGDPFEFGEKVIAFYKGLGIDPKSKMLVFSDGLDLPTILALRDRFMGRIQVDCRLIWTSFGWGTGLTNDLGFKTLSIVAKAIEACGRPLVKLPDNLDKATGDPEEVERYRRIFGHTATYHKIPTC